MRAGEPERGVPARDLPVERAPALGSGGRGEGVAQGCEAGLDLYPGPLGAVVRALARRPGFSQPLGLPPKPLCPLEEGAVGLGVLTDGGRRQGGERRVRRLVLFGPAPPASREPPQDAPGGIGEGA